MHSEAELSRLAAVLEELPETHRGMSIVELDGFVAALIVCPDLIPPSEWLAEVWGEDPEFEDLGSAEAALGAIMGHYNRVAHVLALEPESFAPIYEMDDATGQVMWEAWIAGFGRAMRLRMAAWERIVRSDDEEAAMSVNLIAAMFALVDGTSELEDEAAEELERMAPGLIPSAVFDINDWMKSRHAGGGVPGAATPGAWTVPGPKQVHGRKVGRSEPCPCGSGRKYMRCCASN